MDEFLKYLADAYHIDHLSMTIAVIGAVISYRRPALDKRLHPFMTYFIFYSYIIVSTDIIMYFRTRFPGNNSLLYVYNLEDLLFTVFEFLVFSTYIGRYINKKLTLFANAIFVITALYYLAISFSSGLIELPRVFFMQTLLLLLLCLAYFFKRSNRIKETILTSEAHFWIITGVLIFCLGTFPFSIFSYYLSKHQWELYSNLFSYSMCSTALCS